MVNVKMDTRCLYPIHFETTIVRILLLLNGPESYQNPHEIIKRLTADCDQRSWLPHISKIFPEYFFFLLNVDGLSPLSLCSGRRRCSVLLCLASFRVQHPSPRKPTGNSISPTQLCPYSCYSCSIFNDRVEITPWEWGTFWRLWQVQAIPSVPSLCMAVR